MRGAKGGGDGHGGGEGGGEGEGGPGEARVGAEISCSYSFPTSALSLAATDMCVTPSDAASPHSEGATAAASVLARAKTHGRSASMHCASSGWWGDGREASVPRSRNWCRLGSGSGCGKGQGPGAGAGE